MSRRAARPFLREANAGDIDALASLMTELGYPVSAATLALRLRKMPPSSCTFLAELEGNVAGFVGCSALEIYESDTPVGWIMALSVAKPFWRRGVGRALLARVEQWCAENGISDIRVHSGEHRTCAHAFYKACGFEQTGRRFKKVVRR